MHIPHSKPFLDSSDANSVNKVLESAYLSTGPLCQRFAQKTARLFDKKFSIPTQSGTDALALALFALKQKPGSEIAIPAYICSALLDALKLNGLIPKPLDISKSALAIKTELVNEQKQNISAVIGAHLFGIPAPLHKIEHPVLIEDCAQTINAEIDGIKTGTTGILTVCSFYATKLLTTGHGGAVITDNIDLHTRMTNNINHDNNPSWRPHFHFQMSDFNASLGLSQIEKLDALLKKRREIALRYYTALGTPKHFHSSESYSRFIIIAEDGAEKLIEKFNYVGIEAKRPVYKPIHRYLNLPKKDFPNAEWAYSHIVSIPLYPAMTELEIEYIQQFLEKHKNEMRCRTST
jgi:dTDP-4-amino-4,6-dideoxygalactose transaminase